MIHKYKLKNKTNVILIPESKSPVVSVQAWINTGSADERESESGITHFIEHLLFKGTKKYALGEIASIVESSGGELNAYTSFDHTVYYVTIASSYQDVALDVIKEMVIHPSFNIDDIDAEREVVIEEIKRSKGSPGSTASDLIFSSMFKSHPYSRPILGKPSNIKNFSRKKILSYYNNRYCAENITIVVSGDFDSQKMKKKLDIFSQNSGDIKTIKRAPEPAKLKAKIAVDQTKFKQTRINFTWPIPTLDHPDTPALEMLSLILGYSNSSRLHKALMLQAKPLASSVSSGIYMLKDHGIFLVSCKIVEQDVSDAICAIGEELLDVLGNFVQDDELVKALRMIESEEFYAMETVDGLSRKYGFYYHMSQDVNYFDKYLKKASQVTTNDILRVGSYLNPDQVTISSITNKKNMNSLLQDWCDGYEIGFQLSNVLKPKELSVSKPKASISSFEPTSKESKFYFLSSKSSFYSNTSTPTVSISVGFKGGVGYESSRLSGLSLISSRMAICETQDMTEVKLKEFIDSRASSLTTFCTKNAFGISVVTLTAYVDDFIKILKSILLKPKFNHTILDREKLKIQQYLKSLEDNPSKLAITDFVKNVFFQHTYGKDVLGNLTSISNIKKEDVLDYWRTFMKNPYISVVGNGKAQVYQNFVNSIKCTSGEVYDLPNVKRLIEPKKVFHKIDKPQAHVVLGFQSISVLDNAVYAFKVMEAMLSGQGGSLFLELRDKASLAYTVCPVTFLGLNGGFFAVYIACDPSKVETAISMIRTELKKITEDIQEEKLEGAKKYLIGSYQIGIQRNSSISSLILSNKMLGLDDKYLFEYPNKIKSVKSAQVKYLASRIFSSKEVLVVYSK